jgi:integrase
MGKQVAAGISSVSGRQKLDPRGAAYFEKIATGRYLGYRVNPSGGGTWLLRTTDKNKKHTHHTIGELTEFEEKDRYTQALKYANKYWGMKEKGIEATGTTVAEVCEAYVKYLEVEKGKASAYDAQGRFRRHVYEKPIAKVAIQKLTTADVKAWHLGMAKTTSDDPNLIALAKDGANRNLNSFKAALNYAYKLMSVVSDDGAWKRVTAFRGVARRRETYLTDSEVNALLTACPEDLRVLVEGLFLTALRPGELAAVAVADFNREHGTLNIRTSKTGARLVTLSSAAVEFFALQAKGKLPTAPLVARQDGSYWNKDAWKKIFKAAAIQIRKPELVIYSLRHTAISRLIGGGVDSFLIARLAGTSVAMIEKHYGHLRHDETRQKLDAVLRRA